MKGMFVLLTRCALELEIYVFIYLWPYRPLINEHNSTKVTGVELAMNLSYKTTYAKLSQKSEMSLNAFVMAE